MKNILVYFGLPIALLNNAPYLCGAMLQQQPVILSAMNNSELRTAYENNALGYAAQEQIQEDIFDTAHSMGIDQDDTEFLDSFWENYDPETDGNDWLRE